MSDAEQGMAPMPPLTPVDDDGETEDAIDEPEEGDTPDDDEETEDDEA